MRDCRCTAVVSVRGSRLPHYALLLFSPVCSTRCAARCAFLTKKVKGVLSSSCAPAALLALLPRLPQLFIFYTIQQYGALHFALIMTIRQFLSIVLSCLVFSHDLSSSQWCVGRGGWAAKGGRGRAQGPQKGSGVRVGTERGHVSIGAVFSVAG